MDDAVQDTLLLDLRGFAGDIDTDDATLDEHSRDRSVFSVRPKAVLYPKDADDIATALRAAREARSRGVPATISVRAGGTCMTGGSLDEGFILNLTRHMSAVHIDPIARTASVEAGAYFRDIEDAALAHGLMFAPYPSSRRICGLGGMLGNNASGEKSVRFGATIDNVLSLRVVLEDGTCIETGPKPLDSLDTREERIVALHATHGEALAKAMGQVSKVASGYRLDRVIKDGMLDLTPLFIGAQGTLGVITQATLRLVPVPEHLSLALVCVESIDALPQVLEDALAFRPESIETFDRNTYAGAALTAPRETELTKPYIRSEDAACILVQLSEDTEAATIARADEFVRRADAHSGVRAMRVADPAVAEALWTLRRGAFSEIQNLNTGGHAAVPCIEDVIVPVARVAELVQGLTDILERSGIPYGYHGHIGDGSLRMIPFFDLKEPEAAERIEALMQETFALVKRLGGNTSADHSDGIIRSAFLRGFYGEELFQAFAEIKETFDPEGILNPRKKTGAEEGDLARSLVRC